MHKAGGGTYVHIKSCYSGRLSKITVSSLAVESQSSVAMSIFLVKKSEFIVKFFYDWIDVSFISISEAKQNSVRSSKKYMQNIKQFKRKIE